MPRYEYAKIRQLISRKLGRDYRPTTKLDKPGHARVTIRGVIRADARPRHRVTSEYRPETKNMCYCSRRCWGVDEMFSTDTRGYNEDKKKRNPSTILVPDGRRSGKPGGRSCGGDTRPTS